TPFGKTRRRQFEFPLREEQPIRSLKDDPSLRHCVKTGDGRADARPSPLSKFGNRPAPLVSPPRPGRGGGAWRGVGLARDGPPGTRTCLAPDLVRLREGDAIHGLSVRVIWRHPHLAIAPRHALALHPSLFYFQCALARGIVVFEL
ncbi:hypothetical protein HPB47_002761, partial [Ixodes persulcatus]